VCSRINNATDAESSSNEYDYSNENSRLDESDNYASATNMHANFNGGGGGGPGDKKRKSNVQSSPLNGLAMQGAQFESGSSSSGVFSSNDSRHQPKAKSAQHQFLMQQHQQQQQQQQHQPIHYNSSKNMKNGNKRFDFSQLSANKLH
jgi:hypothetical protein